MQVLPEAEGRARIAWITGVLSYELSGPIGAMVEEGARAIQRAPGRSS